MTVTDGLHRGPLVRMAGGCRRHAGVSSTIYFLYVNTSYHRINGINMAVLTQNDLANWCSRRAGAIDENVVALDCDLLELRFSYLTN